MSPRSLALAAGLLAPASPLLAQFAPAWAWNRSAWFITSTGAISTTRGYEFTVSEPLTVTAIGVFDVENSHASAATALSFPGLAQAHPVALWNTLNTSAPLATATVQAGRATPLCQDGYRYASIPATVLSPGNTYVVAAWWPGDTGAGNFDPHPDLQDSGVTVTFDPRISVGPYRYNLGGAPTQYPASLGTTGNSFTGMLNFRIGAGACEPNPPANLSTTFDANNGQAGNMFDLTALTPATHEVLIHAWQINLGNDATNATPVEVSIYWRDGTFMGHESSSVGWTLLGTQNVLSWGPNQPTPVPIGALLIPSGATRGIFITTNFITGQAPPASPAFLQYSNIPTPGQSTYQNTELRVTNGVGKANPRFTGATFANKAWNGGILYGLVSPPDCYANCDSSTATPVLNVADFTCFLNKFASGDPYANCDASTSFPTLNVADFTCYLTRFATGCP